MVCKKSLYCWKNGPCASDQARKQIWEDNIRFRESLRSMNQSDHYWSFQVSNNSTYCSCIERQYAAPRQPIHSKYIPGTLQKLECSDCTSITHDLKTRHAPKPANNGDIICPLHIGPRPVPNPELNMVQNSLSVNDLNNNRPEPLLTPSTRQKPVEDFPKYCPRYKNTLTNVPMSSSVKFKFSSQPSLLNDKKRSSSHKFEIKSTSPSLENLTKERNDQRRRAARRTGLTTLSKLAGREVCKVDKELDDSQPAPSRKSRSLPRNVYTPLSRTTRRSVLQDRKMPFVTFGCNNVNQDVGTMRTHNVLAAPPGVFPSAINAKQQRQTMIMKFLKQEKDFQTKLLPDNFKKQWVNHSSVWANEVDSKLDDSNTSLSPKVSNVQKVPPLATRQLPNQNLLPREAKQSSSKSSKVFRSRSSTKPFFY